MKGCANPSPLTTPVFIGVSGDKVKGKIESKVFHGQNHVFCSRRAYSEWRYTPFSQCRFYKAKNGEFLLDPEMQEALLEVFKKRGADISLGFDSYEDQNVLVEK